MWIVTQIIAMLAITVKQTAYRISDGYTWAVFLIIVCLFPIIELTLWHSFQTAPSFFRAWFMGTALLALLGFGMTLLYFHETPTVWNIAGAFLALTGAILLVVK